jgi:2-iminobutanoate/2-iminopropanoate deaminase
MSHHREVISTADAPQAIGPYSQAIVAGSLVFVSGQIGLDPKTGQFADGGVSVQTQQMLRNVSAILAAAGCTLQDVVSCTVYLKDMNDFAAMNDVYATFFTKQPPSRASAEVCRLPKDALVEIACIAVRQ